MQVQIMRCVKRIVQRRFTIRCNPSNRHTTKNNWKNKQTKTKSKRVIIINISANLSDHNATLTNRTRLHVYIGKRIYTRPKRPINHQELFFSDECRHLEFTAEQTFQDKRLVNHVIRAHDVLLTDFCDALCYMEHNCASYNLMKKSENEGHRCELNNSTHEGNEKDLE